MRRGDVVVADFPFVDGRSKKRPAVVIQCDTLNAKLTNTMVAMITGNTHLIGKEPTQFLIDPGTPAGKSSGLNHASAVRCNNVMTIAQSNIIHTLGHLSDALKKELNDS